MEFCRVWCSPFPSITGKLWNTGQVPSPSGYTRSLLNRKSSVMSLITCAGKVSKTTREHCTITWEKWSGESGLWALTARPIVILNRWNCTVRWPFSKSGKQPVSFRKEKLDQSCCCEEEKIKLVFFWQVCFCNYEISLGKIILLPSGTKYQVHKNMFPCSFRGV